MRDGESGFQLAEMTSPEVHSELARGRTTIVVPFGAVEQHGRHLPLDTDAVIGDRLSHLLARRLDALCAPTIRIGCSQHHRSIPGTLSIRPETLRMLVGDLLDSLSRHGFRRVILLATHGGNEGPLAEAAAAWKRDGVSIVVPSLRVVADAVLAVAQARGVSRGDAGGHAGELETSLMLALAPELVLAAVAEPGYTGPLDDPAATLLFREGAAALRANGVIGDPRGASVDAGRAYVAAFLDAIQRQLPNVPDAGDAR